MNKPKGINVDPSPPLPDKQSAASDDRLVFTTRGLLGNDAATFHVSPREI